MYVLFVGSSIETIVGSFKWWRQNVQIHPFVPEFIAYLRNWSVHSIHLPRSHLPYWRPSLQHYQGWSDVLGSNCTLYWQRYNRIENCSHVRSLFESLLFFSILSILLEWMLVRKKNGRRVYLQCCRVLFWWCTSHSPLWDCQWAVTW